MKIKYISIQHGKDFVCLQPKKFPNDKIVTQIKIRQ